MENGKVNAWNKIVVKGIMTGTFISVIILNNKIKVKKYFDILFII